jgi:hypothetical protein
MATGSAGTIAAGTNKESEGNDDGDTPVTTSESAVIAADRKAAEVGKPISTVP